MKNLLNEREFLREQYKVLCRMTLPFLRSVFVAFYPNKTESLSATVVETLSQFCREKLQGLPCGQDLAPSDYHFLAPPPYKKFLHGAFFFFGRRRSEKAPRTYGLKLSLSFLCRRNTKAFFFRCGKRYFKERRLY